MRKAFILGNPRSGTSLLRLMLNSHPKIVSPPECGFMHWWYPKYRHWKWRPDSKENLTNLIDDLSTSRKIETWNLDYQKLSDYIASNQPDSYSELAGLIYTFYGRMNGKGPALIVDKNNYYIKCLDDLKSIWPDAIYIHLIRDGRDVACSYMDMKKLTTTSIYKPNLSDKISEIATEWRDNNENIDRFTSALPKGSAKMVKYEDLIFDARGVLNSLSAFLGIPFHEEMLMYNTKSNHNEPEQTLDWKLKTLEAPDPQRVLRYKLFLQKFEVELFNSIAGKTLEKFNYSLALIIP